jgi:hypothetical protein
MTADHLRPRKAGEIACMKNATYFVEKRDALFQLAKKSVDYSISRKELSSALEALGEELLKIADEMHHGRNRIDGLR